MSEKGPTAVVSTVRTSCRTTVRAGPRGLSGYVPLGGREETHVIFDGELPFHLEKLSATEQRDVLEKLWNIARSEAPPDSIVYERIRNIDIFKFSEKGRIYTKVITGIPQGNTHYHVIYVLYIDNDHEYAHSDLAEYRINAQNKLDRITSLTGLDHVEQYLAAQNSLDAGDLGDLLE